MSKWELMTFMHIGDHLESSEVRKLLDQGWEPFATHEPGIMYFRRKTSSPEQAREKDKPKTVVEEIWDKTHEFHIANAVERKLASALAEAVEYMWGRAIYKQKGAEFDGLTSILAILKGEKKREIPKV